VERAVRYAELGLERLWMQDFALGGDLVDVDAPPSGPIQLPPCSATCRRTR
jgi:hypothetical protein